jgi:hypothetical protein
MGMATVGSREWVALAMRGSCAALLALVLCAPAGAQEFGPAVNVSGVPGSAPHMAVGDAGAVHVAWSERAGGGAVAPFTQLLYARSADQGQTFTTPVPLEVGNMYTDPYESRLATRGTAVYAVWISSGKGNPGVLYFARSLDGGASFEPKVFLAAVPQTSYNGRLAVAPDGTLILAYVESQLLAPPSVVVRRSLDGGVTFESSRLIAPVSADYHAVSSLEVAVSPTGTILLAWDNPGATGLHQVWLTRSVDGGVSFSAPAAISGVSVDARNVGLAAGSGGRVHLLWQLAASVGGASSVVYARSADDGVSFFASSLADSGDHPGVAEGPDAAVVAAFAQGGDVLVERSADGGLGFGATQNVSTTTTASLGPRATYAADAALYVLWQEDSQGILLRRASAPAPAPGPSLPPAPSPAPAPGPSALSVIVAVTQTHFAPGQSLVVTAGADNPGLSPAVDFYLGVLLPDGQTVVSFSGAGTTLGQLANVATLAPLSAGFSLAQTFSVSVPGAITYTWAGTEAPGAYVVFLAAVRPGAFADGTADPDDVVALSSATVTFAP